MANWSRLPARARIGRDYFARVGVLRADLPAPLGIVDDLAALAGPGVDLARVHPEVRAFFERTGSHVLHVASHWSWWARGWWRLARRLFALVEQLTPPLRETTMHTALVALDDVREGRPGARGVIRTHADGSVMQVVAYAVAREGAVPLLSVAFPTPLGVLTGLLRLEVRAGEGGALAVTLSSAPAGDGAGVYLSALGRPCRVPLGEEMSLWPGEMCDRSMDIDPSLHPGTTLVGAHTQTLFGVPMVRHRYWFVPRAV